jgi:hypothetical protein
MEKILIVTKDLYTAIAVYSRQVEKSGRDELRTRGRFRYFRYTVPLGLGFKPGHDTSAIRLYKGRRFRRSSGPSRLLEISSKAGQRATSDKAIDVLRYASRRKTAQSDWSTIQVSVRFGTVRYATDVEGHGGHTCCKTELRAESAIDGGSNAQGL